MEVADAAAAAAADDDDDDDDDEFYGIAAAAAAVVLDGECGTFAPPGHLSHRTPGPTLKTTIADTCCRA